MALLPLLDEVGEVMTGEPVRPMAGITPEDMAQLQAHAEAMEADGAMYMRVVPMTMLRLLALAAQAQRDAEAVARQVQNAREGWAAANAAVDRALAAEQEVARLERKVAEQDDALTALATDRELPAGPCPGPDECPTWYDGCNCSTSVITYNIKRAERAEAALAAAEQRFDALEREAQRLRHEHNATKPIDDPACCTGCGGQYAFDTTLSSTTWNRVIRAAGLPEFLCTACIVRAFAKAGEGFTAQLWSLEFNGVPVEFSINGTTANSHAEMSEENTRLRASIAAAEQRGRQLEAALQLIAEDDVLVEQSAGAWGLQAYERRRDIARAALAPPESAT